MKGKCRRKYNEEMPKHNEKKNQKPQKNRLFYSTMQKIFLPIKKIIGRVKRQINFGKNIYNLYLR